MKAYKRVLRVVLQYQTSIYSNSFWSEHNFLNVIYLRAVYIHSQHPEHVHFLQFFSIGNHLSKARGFTRHVYLIGRPVERCESPIPIQCVCIPYHYDAPHRLNSNYADNHIAMTKSPHAIHFIEILHHNNVPPFRFALISSLKIERKRHRF